MNIYCTISEKFISDKPTNLHSLELLVKPCKKLSTVLKLPGIPVQLQAFSFICHLCGTTLTALGAAIICGLCGCSNLPQITFHKDPSVQTTKNKVERRCAAQKQINTKGYALCAADAIFVEVDPKDQELGALRAQFIIAMSARLGADRFPGPDASNDAAELLINIGNAEDSIGSLLLASANSTDYMAPVNRAQVITTTIYVAWSAIKPVLKQDKDTLLTLPPTERLTQSREILAHLAAENIHLDCYKEALFLAKNQSSERDTGGNHWQWMKQDFMRKCDRVAQLSKLENEDSYCKKFPCKYLHEAGVVYE